MKNRGNKVYTQTVDLTGADSIRLANIMIYPNDIIYVAPNDLKPFNTKVGQYSPVFGLVSSILNPIVNIKYLSNN